MEESRPDTDEARLVEQTVLDYVEGWFDGDSVRMRRALHPQLAKRSLRTDAGADRVETLTADQMVRWTADGEGRRLDRADREIVVSVHRIDGRIASATCVCALYIDHLQLARTHEGWRIVNVLWSGRR